MSLYTRIDCQLRQFDNAGLVRDHRTAADDLTVHYGDEDFSPLREYRFSRLLELLSITIFEQRMLFQPRAVQPIKGSRMGIRVGEDEDRLGLYRFFRLSILQLVSVLTLLSRATPR